MTVILTVELLQARREAAIERSKILMEATKNKLRSVPFSSESLFGSQVAALQKSNSESQHRVVKLLLLGLKFRNAQTNLLIAGILLLDLRIAGIEVVLEEVLVVEALALMEGINTPPPKEMPPTLRDNDMLPLSCPRKDLPVGGWLTHFHSHWGEITEDSWGLCVIRKGYKIPFVNKPFLSPTLIFLQQTESLALVEEVNKLLLKGAVEKIELEGPGFYSHIFLVPKKNRK